MERARFQSQTLEAAFEVYFRVIKNAAGDEAAEGTPLLGSALRGLGRQALLISIDYLADLMGSLRALLQKGGLPLPLRVRALAAANEVMSGPGAALNVDAAAFHAELYSLLGEGSPPEGEGGAELLGVAQRMLVVALELALGPRHFHVGVKGAALDVAALPLEGTAPPSRSGAARPEQLARAKEKVDVPPPRR